MHARPKTTRSALSLVELLIAMAITAILLTATGLAFQSGLQANEANLRLHDAVVAARNTMEYILRICRTAESIGMCSGTPQPTDDPNMTLSGTLIVELGGDSSDVVGLYWDESDTDTPLKYYSDLDGTPKVSTMLPSVQSLTFEREMAVDANPDNPDYTSRLIVTITVQVGEMYHTLSGSVAPRKALKRSEEPAE
jgi:prepilin-type N-terminal cleavage/methylation domain-containing protein